MFLKLQPNILFTIRHQSNKIFHFSLTNFLIFTENMKQNKKNKHSLIAKISYEAQIKRFSIHY